MQNEAIARVLAGDIGDDESLWKSLHGMRAEIEAARATLDAGEVAAASLPHRRRYLDLIQRYGRALLDVHEAWLDEAERELRGRGEK
jgi:hypothetical protein